MQELIKLALIITAIIMLLTGVAYSKKSTICLCGNLYYDWDGRPFGVCVPVLKDGKMIKCKDKK